MYNVKQAFNSKYERFSYIFWKFLSFWTFIDRLALSSNRQYPKNLCCCFDNRNRRHWYRLLFAYRSPRKCVERNALLHKVYYQKIFLIQTYNKKREENMLKNERKGNEVNKKLLFMLYFRYYFKKNSGFLT